MMIACEFLQRTSNKYTKGTLKVNELEFLFSSDKENC